MSFGVDTLGGLSEKLKQLSNDTQSMYEAFIDATQLYKQGKMGEKEYFARIGDYLVATSAMNFLAIRVIFEIKGAMDKGTSVKNPTGGVATAAPPQQAGFGIGGFVNAGGSVGPSAGYTLPSPQAEPTFKPVDIELPRPKASGGSNTKSCVFCGASIPQHAKFCSKCGKSQ
ncbi:zinc ribbon domain-containing protein [Nitrososphaera viennensis]|uniref:Zinc-ribbon domain-containing protein n=2 Tax=Nitrososphaera viennensis TaxID=1034015 RepID=A0A060HTV1_9ARCH|nr:zinc ribbon domain-containing protein [Nitrososphaera viennensis]AIC16522.1 hypothetical protein NVIE_022600 [Nitrososphaera viennensis EN76]UVS68455.1 zinc ribbon domain-containing protein [Nitrososphaera viennensis]